MLLIQLLITLTPIWASWHTVPLSRRERGLDSTRESRGGEGRYFSVVQDRAEFLDTLSDILVTELLHPSIIVWRADYEIRDPCPSKILIRVRSTNRPKRSATPSCSGCSSRANSPTTPACIENRGTGRPSTDVSPCVVGGHEGRQDVPGRAFARGDAFDDVAGDANEAWSSPVSLPRRKRRP